MPHAQYFTYADVHTPNIASDIREYVLPDASPEGVSELLESPHYDKLTVLAERLEFVRTLGVLHRKIESRHRYDKQEVDRGNGTTQLTKHARCTWLCHDFAGVHWDIEALQIYLLITCLDTIAGKTEDKKPFEWLGELGREQISIADLDALASQYYSEHGLSRRFKALFCERLSSSLRADWIASY